MTSIAFIMGCLPLAVATGAGAGGAAGGRRRGHRRHDDSRLHRGIFAYPSFFYLIAKLAGLDKKAARKLQEKEQGAPAPAKQAE